MKKNVKILLAGLCLLIVILIAVIVSEINTRRKNNSTNNIVNNISNQSKSDGNQLTNNSQDNGDVSTKIDENIKVNGKYVFKNEYENYYHYAEVELSNQDSSSIEFSISAAHGTSVNSVNTGELKGKANKVDIPDGYTIPNSIQYAYEFIDKTTDGKTNKITFVYTAHRMFQYVSVIEDYASNVNPYGGHDVYFDGEYDKV